MYTESAPDNISFFRHMTRAFASRNYRLFFGGQLVSLVGTFITQVATAWLVYRLAKTGAHPELAESYMGNVLFAGQIALFFLTPFTGVWVDRVDRQRLLVTTQSFAMLQSFSLALLVFSHHISIPWVIALAFIQGVINSFDMPGRQAFLVQILEKRENLANAIALNSTMVHGARLIGPAIAGFVIAAVGEGWCFFIDGISYIGVIAALLAMRIRPAKVRLEKTSARSDLVEGFKYVWHFTPVRALLLLMSLVSLTGVPALMTLMPTFADHLSRGHSGPATPRYRAG